MMWLLLCVVVELIVAVGLVAALQAAARTDRQLARMEPMGGPDSIAPSQHAA
jgi:poly(3-hydroxybutyrate) depolymerase